MRRTILLLAISAAALVAGCSSTEAGWTYAPPTEPPASQPAPSGEASAPPSAAPSGEAPSGEPSQAPSGTVLKIAAQNVAFDTDQLSAPADAAFQIEFANNDPGIPHNVEIKDSAGTSVFTGDIFNGVETRTYDVPPLAAGTYTFICTVHPNMTGTLTVGG